MMVPSESVTLRKIPGGMRMRSTVIQLRVCVCRLTVVVYPLPAVPYTVGKPDEI